MMTSSNGIFFRGTGPLYGELTADRWIPPTKASDTELWYFLWSAPWINGWVNNREAGDLRRHRAHYDVTVMYPIRRTKMSPINTRYHTHTSRSCRNRSLSNTPVTATQGPPTPLFFFSFFHVWKYNQHECNCIVIVIVTVVVAGGIITI